MSERRAVRAGPGVLAAGTLLGQHLPERSRPLRHGGSARHHPGITTAPGLHCAAPRLRSPVVPPVRAGSGRPNGAAPVCDGNCSPWHGAPRGNPGRGGSGFPEAVPVPGFRDAASRLSCSGFCSGAEPSHLRGPARPRRAAACPPAGAPRGTRALRRFYGLFSASVNKIPSRHRPADGRGQGGRVPVFVSRQRPRIRGVNHAAV